jgi:hypothetical protein
MQENNYHNCPDWFLHQISPDLLHYTSTTIHKKEYMLASYPRRPNFHRAKHHYTVADMPQDSLSHPRFLTTTWIITSWIKSNNPWTRIAIFKNLGNLALWIITGDRFEQPRPDAPGGLHRRATTINNCITDDSPCRPTAWELYIRAESKIFNMLVTAIRSSAIQSGACNNWELLTTRSPWAIWTDNDLDSRELAQHLSALVTTL